MEKIRLGIVGTGAVANFMTAFMLFRPDIELVCVASRSCQKAEQFAGRYYIPHWCGDYRELPAYELDMVYIATLPDVHYEIAKYFIDHGIGVLCEKPFVFDQQQAEELLSLVKEKQVLFMLNLVTAYLPAMQVMKDCLACTGKVKAIRLSIGNRHEPDGSRLFTDPKYGGVFCDLSCYVFYFLSCLIREYPKRVETKSIYHGKGIDMETILCLHYPDGEKAVCRMSVMEDMEGSAEIICENGIVRIENFGRGGRIYICMNGQEELKYDPSYRFHGFEFVFDEMVRCFRASLWESPCLNHTQIGEINQCMIDLLPMVKEADEQ